jgi:hypothetical protein
MIVEYIRYQIDPSRNGECDDAYRRAGALLDASPHCQRWEAAPLRRRPREADRPHRVARRTSQCSTPARNRGWHQVTM